MRALPYLGMVERFRGHDNNEGTPILGHGREVPRS